MKQILILSTGGTFNKIYDPIAGELVVDGSIQAVQEIMQRWQADYHAMACIGKDSLDMTDADREELLSVLSQARSTDIVVVHGTDTMEISAEYVAQARLPKRIVFTGAMVPYRIDPVEATANLALAIGALHAPSSPGVYLAMNGIFGSHRHVTKDREAGRFVLRDSRGE